MLVGGYKETLGRLSDFNNLMSGGDKSSYCT